ncbi:MAG: glycosyltransferase family 2 protein [Bacteroidales bacterium]|nr:glycosyltransferase family 2 protein [Bacteroidales bacterium]
MIAVALFWTATGIALYCYVGYPLLLWLMRMFAPPPPKTSEAELPELTLVVPAYNEAPCVERKMRNTLELSYPAQRIHLMWVIDGSTDATATLLARYPQVEVLYQPERRGKTAALNRAMVCVRTPIAVLSDANTDLSTDALRHLVQPFAYPDVGCVAGEKRIAQGAAPDAAGRGEGLYWRYESALKQLESDTGSTLSAAGELLAMRTSLYCPMPESTILDDFELSMRIAQDGHRVLYCPQALASEGGSADIGEEWKRKVRIAAGGYQQLQRQWRLLLNPLGHPMLWFKLFSHKLLRWAVVPWCLLLAPGALAVAVVQGAGAFYSMALLLLIMAYAVALLGHVLRRKQLKPSAIYLPYYALMANMAQLAGLVRWCTRGQDVRWEKVERTSAEPL